MPTPIGNQTAIAHVASRNGTTAMTHATKAHEGPIWKTAAPACEDAAMEETARGCGEHHVHNGGVEGIDAVIKEKAEGRG